MVPGMVGIYDLIGEDAGGIIPGSIIAVIHKDSDVPPLNTIETKSNVNLMTIVCLDKYAACMIMSSDSLSTNKLEKSPRQIIEYLVKLSANSAGTINTAFAL
jgi:hypothetical protein